jgi:hypothetical protein
MHLRSIARGHTSSGDDIMSHAGLIPLVESPAEQTTEIKRILVSSVIGTAVGGAAPNTLLLTKAQ